jgi:hypothetical protein
MAMWVETKPCPGCKQTHSVRVDPLGYAEWQDGMPIQRAMPELSAPEREILITGICPPCWGRMFSGEAYP